MLDVLKLLAPRRERFRAWLSALSAPISPTMSAQLENAFVGSEYFEHSLSLETFDLAEFLVLLEVEDPIPHLLSDQRQIALLECADRDEFDRELRRLRRMCQCLLIARDLNRIVDTVKTCRDISFAADYFIETAREWHFIVLCNKHGTPLDRSGEMIELAILGMGKLGGRELNLSSDIDLIFCYREDGCTNGEKPLEHQRFFTRLGQRLIKSLDEITVEGFVYRVDMRLRPYGDSGTLVSSFDAFETYLQTQGRPWERYAMAKARVISRHQRDTDYLYRVIRPFSFRRYVDFSVIDSLREIKELIKSENKRLNRSNNVKLGVGGIREAEFVVQSFQVVRGGRDVVLQQASLIDTLPHLVALNLLSEKEVNSLRRAYLFLRDVEHLIQGWRDEQSQKLPADDDGIARVAWFMGFSSVEAFMEQLDAQRAFVGDLFSATISEHSVSSNSKIKLEPIWYQVWEGDRRLPGEFGARVDASISDLKNSRVFQSLSIEVIHRIDELIPRLLAACAATHNDLLAFERTWPLISSVLRRSTYMVLLLENPASLAECVRLSLASPYIADQISKHPALLNELINAQQLYQPPTKDQLRSELRLALMRLNWDDLEGHMDVLRYFKRSHVLRVAACEVTDRLKLMKVSDYLSWLAEVILEQVVAIAWQQMVHRYGAPVEDDAELMVGDRFNVIAYGKLGGIELNYSSDLDVVFVHDTNAFGETNGVNPIDNQTFFARLGQRVLHILTTEMPSGRLYEMDTRLRPSGHSGPLVSTFRAFEKYQLQSAWVWEHQALIRTRVVFGDRELAQKFNELRLTILTMPKANLELRNEVVKMREKMLEHLSNKDTEYFDLKHDRGGMVDIEFIVQYLLLENAQTYPALVKWSDNMRIIDSLVAAEILSKEEGSSLQRCYGTLRERYHELALQQQPTKIARAELEDVAKMVKTCWYTKVEVEGLE